MVVRFMQLSLYQCYEVESIVEILENQEKVAETLFLSQVV